MRTLILSLLFTIVLSLPAQEFHYYKNGLIYSPQVIDNLSKIANSLNLKHRSCNNYKQHVSFSQTFGFDYSTDDSIQIDAAIKAMQLGAGKSEVKKILGYSSEPVDDTLLLFRYRYFNEDRKSYLLRTTSLGDYSLDAEVSPDSVKEYLATDGGYWYWNVERVSWTKKRWLTVFYLIRPFIFQPIPEKYNAWINYGDCMLDTTVSVLHKDAVENTAWGFFDNAENDTIKNKYQEELVSLLDKIEYSGKEPEEPEYYNGVNKDSLKIYEKQMQDYTEAHYSWSTIRDRYIKKKIRSKIYFNKIAELAYQEARKTKKIHSKTVDYIARFYSKEKALDLLRGQIVVGFCSMDQSPRYHLMNIAVLSAETGNWEVFLKSHLDLINDRVRRASDNSIAHQYRGVYIRELESLPLNFAELLPGINFRIDNAAPDHYFGNIPKTGRMMALSFNAVQYRELLFSIAGDQKLDLYNRMIFAFIANNYLYYYYEKEEDYKKQLSSLREQIEDIPVFVKRLLESE